MNMNVLTVERLTKTFNDKVAVDDASFSITEGSITGFLGPNGAGKSTVMNIIMGFISATDGTVSIFGEKVSVDTPTTRQQIGFLSNSSKLDRGLTATQEIEYFGKLGGEYDHEYVDSLVRKLKLDTSQKIGGLSTGNYQKVALIIALMHQPKLLVLDEPTNGLDPLVQDQFNKIILDFKKKGSTIFISSHILSEVQELCDEFIFIKDGRIAAQLTRKSLLGSSNRSLVVQTTEKNHRKLLKYLKENEFTYREKDGDIDEIFMEYYGDDDA